MPTLAVKVVPGSSRSAVAGRYGDGVKVQVSAAPEKGQANAAVAELLAEYLNLSRSQITIISGHSRPRKLFRIDGLSDEELQAKLAPLE